MNPTNHLTQSIYESMACPHSFGLVQIQGLKPPDTLASNRGRDIHELMAAYSEHCATRRVPMDLSFFDGLILDTGDDAAVIMQNAGESIRVDWQNFFAAEVGMGLDADFKPTDYITHDGEILPPDHIWRLNGTGQPTRYAGKPDEIALFPGGRLARIRDFKSHPRPFEPTTFQAKLYSLMLFMHMPELEEVEFVLVFVRYTNMVRPIKYYREQVPYLKDEVRRADNRRRGYVAAHEAGEELPAFAGTHCTYCPVVSNFKCPIAQLNPMLELEPEKRLHYRLWYAAQSRANNQAMSQMVEGSGQSIHATDANGNNYTFGPVPTDKTTYPVFKFPEGADASTIIQIFGDPYQLIEHMPIVNALANHAIDNPDDFLPSKRSGKPAFDIRIGSTELNKPLKAKKREVIHNNVKDLAQTEKTVVFKVTRDAEVDEGTGEEYQTFNPADPNNDNIGAAAWEP